jgi:hypothetical protein
MISKKLAIARDGKDVDRSDCRVEKLIGARHVHTGAFSDLLRVTIEV